MEALLAAWLLSTAAAPSEKSFAGLYEIHQMEMAGALELNASGHFRYALSYGAVDEEAEGDWTVDDGKVLLTSDPMPKAPDFEVVRDERAPKGELIVLLEEPYQGWNGPIEGFVVPRDGHEPYDLDLDQDGRSAFASTHVKSVIPRIPVYGGLGSPIPISPDRGHRLLLRFKPNDLGKAAFDKQPLARTGDDLLLSRYDTVIRFLRVRP